MEEWQDMLDEWNDDPESACNHLVLGMNIHQRRQARQTDHKNSVSTWI